MAGTHEEVQRVTSTDVYRAEIYTTKHHTLGIVKVRDHVIHKLLLLLLLLRKFI